MYIYIYMYVNVENVEMMDVGSRAWCTRTEAKGGIRFLQPLVARKKDMIFTYAML